MVAVLKSLIRPKATPLCELIREETVREVLGATPWRDVNRKGAYMYFLGVPVMVIREQSPSKLARDNREMPRLGRATVGGSDFPV